MKKINFIFGVHNHQPVGNFDHVFEWATKQAYEPFLDVIEKHPSIKIVFHYTGCLIDWFEKNTMPAAEYFRGKPDVKFLEINGEGGIEEIHKDILRQTGLSG